jgi:putative ATP-dependent endonuclease of the OLD family
MKICEIHLTNYRTVEDLTIKLAGNYIALSGKNNSGKSNVLRALRVLLTEEGPSFITDGVELDYGIDFPKWKEKEKERGPISIAVSVQISKVQDTSIFRFLNEFLQRSSDDTVEHIELKIQHTIKHGSPEPELSVSCDGKLLTDSFKASEIARRLRTSRGFVFHNSINFNSPFRQTQNSLFPLSGISTSERESVNAARDKLTTQLKKLAERQQKEILDLIGRLEERYHVSLDVPRLGIENMPMRVSLGEKASTIPLDEWGSGTQNRTAILMALLRAKQSSQLSMDGERVAPILVLEEPESFLHPSAQAEFGRMLQDLSDEFGIQVITTTHSPYMLSLRNPEANVLLARTVDKKIQLGTHLVATTGDTWMEPFGKALGIDNDAFSNWKNLLFKPSSKILLVEGKTDVDYFDLLRSNEHGAKALNFDGEIFPYEGAGFFSNTVLLKFLISRFNQVFITYDLDKATEVEPKLKAIGLKNGRDFTPIGVDKPGLRDIEGLLPTSIRSAVYANNAEKVAHAQSAEKDRADARNDLKKLLFNQFKETAKAGQDYDAFYGLARIIEKAFK